MIPRVYVVKRGNKQRKPLFDAIAPHTHAKQVVRDTDKDGCCSPCSLPMLTVPPVDTRHPEPLPVFTVLPVDTRHPKPLPMFTVLPEDTRVSRFMPGLPALPPMSPKGAVLRLSDRMPARMGRSASIYGH